MIPLSCPPSYLCTSASVRIPVCVFPRVSRFIYPLLHHFELRFFSLRTCLCLCWSACVSLPVFSHVLLAMSMRPTSSDARFHLPCQTSALEKSPSVSCLSFNSFYLSSLNLILRLLPLFSIVHLLLFHLYFTLLLFRLLLFPRPPRIPHSHNISPSPLSLPSPPRSCPKFLLVLFFILIYIYPASPLPPLPFPLRPPTCSFSSLVSSTSY